MEAQYVVSVGDRTLCVGLTGRGPVALLLLSATVLGPLHEVLGSPVQPQDGFDQFVAHVHDLPVYLLVVTSGSVTPCTLASARLSLW